MNISAKTSEWLAQFPSQDRAITALTIWRENRGGGKPGMQSVCNAIGNRTRRRRSSFFAECTRAWQFTSMTVESDPEYNLLPQDSDSLWSLAMNLADLAVSGVLPDLTNGSTVYYNPNGIDSTHTIELPSIGFVKFPSTWNPAVLVFKGSIAKHLFFVER